MLNLFINNKAIKANNIKVKYLMLKSPEQNRAIITIAPKSSIIANAVKNTFNDNGTLLPNKDKTPNENAISVADGIAHTDDDLFKKFWPASIHLIGKDILRFHAVYWPAFLLAAKIDLPKKVYGHGWILSGEEKMSKSKGNILDPLEIIKEYGLDPLRYYLIKEVSFGNDGNISQERLEDCINSDLANNYGNLCQRVTA